jgi:hypothetical protein
MACRGATDRASDADAGATPTHTLAWEPSGSGGRQTCECYPVEVHYGMGQKGVESRGG